MFKIAKPNRSCYPFIAPKIASRDIRCRPENSEYLALPIQPLQIETKTKA
jgi:hypothetical protein